MWVVGRPSVRASEGNCCVPEDMRSAKRTASSVPERVMVMMMMLKERVTNNEVNS